VQAALQLLPGNACECTMYRPSCRMKEQCSTNWLTKGMAVTVHPRPSGETAQAMLGRLPYSGITGSV
jgi:hypothetical protein